MKEKRKKHLYIPPDAKRGSKKRKTENEPDWAVPVGMIILLLAAAGFFSLVRELLNLLF